MRNEPNVSASRARFVIDALAEIGVDWPALCARCGIDPGSFDAPDGRIPLHKIQALWRGAAQDSGDPNFGLHLGERVQPRATNVVTYLVMSAATLRDSLEHLVRYQQLLGDGDRFEIEPNGACTFLRIDTECEDPVYIRHQTEYRAVVTLSFCRWLSGQNVRPQEAFFAHPGPDDVSEHERVFGCPVRFGTPASGLLLSDSDLALPSVHANPQIEDLHEEAAERTLASLDGSSLGARLRSVLLSALESSPPDLEEAARRLEMSPRTLQRRLAEERTAFRDVVESVRRELAEALLVDSSAPIERIARLAGYSDARAFRRSFKRWTGVTPAAYRGTRPRAREEDAVAPAPPPPGSRIPGP